MMNTRVLRLAAPLFFGAALGAFAAPQKTNPAKSAPKHSIVSSPNVAAPFRDVPPNHWAAQAVETLRQAGIVHGYPGKASQKVRGTQGAAER